MIYAGDGYDILWTESTDTVWFDAGNGNDLLVSDGGGLSEHYWGGDGDDCILDDNKLSSAADCGAGCDRSSTTTGTPGTCAFSALDCITGMCL